MSQIFLCSAQCSIWHWRRQYQTVLQLLPAVHKTWQLSDLLWKEVTHFPPLVFRLSFFFMLKKVISKFLAQRFWNCSWSIDSQILRHKLRTLEPHSSAKKQAHENPILKKKLNLFETIDLPHFDKLLCIALCLLKRRICPARHGGFGEGGVRVWIKFNTCYCNKCAF